MNKEFLIYNNSKSPEGKKICDILYRELNKNLPELENEIGFAHPVWFLDENHMEFWKG